MRPATASTVIGDFSDAKLEHFGTATTFTRSGDKFLARTDGPDGATRDYEIAYTFGFYPLQQYLIAMPGGRLQALGIAWDNRPQDQGGQRWFHLYPNDRIRPGDRLHWTGRDQTWNYMCADCHSTGLAKNYDLASDTYATSWSEVNVACEACHGPGSHHVAWAEAGAGAGSSPGSGLSVTAAKSLSAWLKTTESGKWQINPGANTAKRTESLVSAELDTCAACHARRKPLVRSPPAGSPFLDSYQPVYLEPGLYHADGQIDGEVFEYGSFVQSRMHRAGVSCSNCHEPHGLKLRASGNAVCAQCHLPQHFEAATHHHHKPDSPGAQCVSCHMPAKTYMAVDNRHDHSFRIPRPDLSIALGVPNACTQCHTTQSPAWAAAAIASWFPQGRHTQPHFGQALHAGRTGAADAEIRLGALIRDRTQPGIARGSALLLLSRYASPASEVTIRDAAGDEDPLVRAAVPRALPMAPSRPMVQAVASLLNDPVRAVRVAAARALAGVHPQLMTQEQRSAYLAAYRELTESELVDADRPESHLNLGLLHARRQQLADAEAAYRTALRLDPMFVPALINLADVQRERGLDQQGAELLRKAMTIEPGNADVRHSLALLLVRQHKYAEALPLLRQAAEMAPDNARYGYVLAIALNGAGASGEAVRVLEQAHRIHPANRDILTGLILIARDRGDLAAALQHARKAVELYPSDTQFRSLIQDVERRQPR